MTLAMRFSLIILILLSGCGNKEGPPMPVYSDNEVVSVRETLQVRETECYKQTLQIEEKENEKITAELLAASAEKSTLIEYLATSKVQTAEFDLEICRRYAQCYDISDEKRRMNILSCINEREQIRNETADM